MKKIIALLLILVLTVSMVACTKLAEAPVTPAPAETPETPATPAEVEDIKVDVDRIRVLIGSSSTGGDSYQNADIISRFLAEELGTNTKVDAIDVKQALDELAKAKPDGSTVMVFHDQTYLGVDYGSIDEKHALENWKLGPTLAINPGDAFLAKHDAPYNTLVEAADWLKENTDKTLTVAIQAGGVSQIGFDAFYNFIKAEYDASVLERVKAYVTGSQGDKNQALWDGNADIIHGSVIANEEYTKDGVDAKIKMKFLGLTGKERQAGIEAPTFAEQGITVDGKPFVFDKEFFVIFPKDIDATFEAKFNKAVDNIVKAGEYEKELNNQKFIINYRTAEEASVHLLEKKDTMKEIIKNTPDLDVLTSK